MNNFRKFASKFMCSRSAQKESTGCGTDLPLFGGDRSIIAMLLNATSLFLSATKHRR